MFITIMCSPTTTTAAQFPGQRLMKQELLLRIFRLQVFDLTKKFTYVINPKGRVQKKKNLEFSRFSGWVGLKKSIFQI